MRPFLVEAVTAAPTPTICAMSPAVNVCVKFTESSYTLRAPSPSGPRTKLQPTTVPESVLMVLYLRGSVSVRDGLSQSGVLLRPAFAPPR